LRIRGNENFGRPKETFAVDKQLQFSSPFDDIRISEYICGLVLKGSNKKKMFLAKGI